MESRLTPSHWQWVVSTSLWSLLALLVLWGALQDLKGPTIIDVLVFTGTSLGEFVLVHTEFMEPYQQLSRLGIFFYFLVSSAYISWFSLTFLFFPSCIRYKFEAGISLSFTLLLRLGWAQMVVVLPSQPPRYRSQVYASRVCISAFKTESNLIKILRVENTKVCHLWYDCVFCR